MRELWGWTLHRLSGLALIPLAALHVWAWHSPERQPIVFAGVSLRLRTTTLLATEAALLALALYHGLAGLRNVLGDWWFVTRRREARLSLALWLAGLILLTLGVWALATFLRGETV